MAIRTENIGDLQLDQLLHGVAGQLGKQLPCGAAIE
jgi:hypothetical protein